MLTDCETFLCYKMLASLYQKPIDRTITNISAAHEGTCCYKQPFSSDTVYYKHPENRLQLQRPERVEDYVQRTKKTAAYLKLLLHSKKCSGKCMKSSCLQTSRIHEHIICCVNDRCCFPGCQTSKKLLNHYEKCKGENTLDKDLPGYNLCLLCSLISHNSHNSINTAHHVIGTRSLDNNFSPTRSLNTSQDEEDNHRYDGSDGELIIFDEIMEFSKVPFQDCSPSGYNRRITSSLVSLSNDSPSTYDYEDEPPRKIRSKSLDFSHVDHIIC